MKKAKSLFLRKDDSQENKPTNKILQNKVKEIFIFILIYCITAASFADTAYKTSGQIAATFYSKLIVESFKNLGAKYNQNRDLANYKFNDKKLESLHKLLTANNVAFLPEGRFFGDKFLIKFEGNIIEFSPFLLFANKFKLNSHEIQYNQPLEKLHQAVQKFAKEKKLTRTNSSLNNILNNLFINEANALVGTLVVAAIVVVALGVYTLRKESVLEELNGESARYESQKENLEAELNICRDDLEASQNGTYVNLLNENGTMTNLRKYLDQAEALGNEFSEDQSRVEALLLAPTQAVRDRRCSEVISNINSSLKDEFEYQRNIQLSEIGALQVDTPGQNICNLANEYSQCFESLTSTLSSRVRESRDSIPYTIQGTIDRYNEISNTVN